MAVRALRIVRLVAGTLALVCIVAISLRIATSAAAHASSFLVPSARHGYPSWMQGPLRSFGSGLGLTSFLWLLTAFAGAYVVALLCATVMPAWLVLGGIALSTAIFTLAPPILSQDLFNYIAYARMGGRGINPYAHGPILIKADPIYPYIGHLWNHTPSAYGPLYTWSTYAIEPLGIAASVWILKALAGVATLGCVALLFASARRIGRPPVLAAAIFGLNPLVLVYAVGGGHNDLLMAFLLLLGLYLAIGERLVLAGVALVAAVAIKLTAALVIPFVLLGARRRLRLAGGLAAAALAIGALSLAAFGPQLANIVRVSVQDQRFNWVVVSVPGFVGHYLGLGRLTPSSRTVLLGVFAFACLVFLVRSRGGLKWLEGAAAASFALLVTTAWVLPWYILWLLSPAALVRKRLVPAAAVVLSLLLLGMQVDHFVLTRHSHRRVHVRADVATRRAHLPFGSSEISVRSFQKATRSLIGSTPGNGSG